MHAQLQIRLLYLKEWKALILSEEYQLLLLPRCSFSYQGKRIFYLWQKQKVSKSFSRLDRKHALWWILIQRLELFHSISHRHLSGWLYCAISRHELLFVYNHESDQLHLKFYYHASTETGFILKIGSVFLSPWKQCELIISS